MGKRSPLDEPGGMQVGRASQIPIDPTMTPITDPNTVGGTPGDD